MSGDDGYAPFGPFEDRRDEQIQELQAELRKVREERNKLTRDIATLRERLVSEVDAAVTQDRAGYVAGLERALVLLAKFP